MKVRDTAGPFFTPRLLYRLGFHWQEELSLVEEYAPIPNYTPPQWAVAASPYGGVAGKWNIDRHRLRWRFIPLGPWRPGAPKFRPPR